MKPLYLDGRTPLSVALDGPALRVAAQAAADRWFPLRNVSRVVVSGRVEWRTDAMLACADRGITVSFLDRFGEPRARWYGADGPRNELAQRLVDFLDRPDSAELYAQWCMAMHRQCALLCVWRLHLPRGHNNRTLKTLVWRRIAAHLSARDSVALRKQLGGVVYSEVLAQLHRSGIDADALGLPKLPFEIASMAAWVLYPDLVRWVERIARRNGAGASARLLQRRAVVGFTEKNIGQVRFQLSYLLVRLGRFLVELQ